MIPRYRARFGAPVRRAIAAACAALALAAPQAAPRAADEYINKKELPDPVLKPNIERLATYVVSQELNEKNLRFRVTRILGRESLGNGKERVWFCIEGNVNGKRSNGCGGDDILIRLDTGRWILQDAKRGSWVVVEQ